MLQCLVQEVSTKSNRSQQGTFGPLPPGLDQQKGCQQVKGCDVSPLVRTSLQSYVEFWAPQSKRHVDILEREESRVTKVIKGLELLSFEEGLRVGTVRPGEEEAQRGFIDV